MGEVKVAMEKLARAWLVLAAALTAILLAAPGFRFPYLFDDYNFLSAVSQHGLKALIPDPGAVFYRPISRVPLFGVLSWLSPGNAALGHMINATLLAAIVVLGAGLAARLLGRRAGVIAAFSIAVFGQWPVLVAWVAGVQDLLAIALLLMALHLQLSGKSWEALLVFAVSLLSKETAAVCAPALIAAQWLRSRSLRSTYSVFVKVLALVVVWGVAHPGIRALVLRSGATLPGTYIGLDHPIPSGAFLRYMALFLNVLAPGYKVSWPGEVTWALILAAFPLSIGLWRARRVWEEPDPSPALPPTWEVIGFGLLLCALPALLTSLVVRNWAPYYACFSAVGASLIVSAWLARRSYRVVVIFLSVSLVLGSWSRGVLFGNGIPSERDLAGTGDILVRVEKNFKRVAPSLPPSSIVYLSTMATNKKGLYAHLHTFQVLRAWYGDPEIETLRPELWVNSSAPAALFGIDQNLDVLRIDMRSLTATSSGGAVRRESYRGVLTSFAIGLADAGEISRAVSILLELSPPDSWEHVRDRRIAATLLLSQGQVGPAMAMVQNLPMLPTREAIETVGLLLTAPDRGAHLEEAALLAFGFSPKDPKVLRPLLRGLLGLGYFEVSERIARKLLNVVPGDPEATTALERAEIEQKPAVDRIVPPIQRLDFSRE